MAAVIFGIIFTAVGGVLIFDRQNRVVPSQGITARSDRAAVTFGKGLPEDELAYLHALIRKALTD